MKALVAPRIDVEGAVITALEAPVAGRSVAVVGADGARKHLSTNVDGIFAAAGVLPPYDVAVLPTSGPATIYLGLRRPDPWIELFARDDVGTSAETQTIRVRVRSPACRASSCAVTVITASASGRGVATATCDGAGVVAIDAIHRFRARHRIESSEQIDVHVLVADRAREAFAYGRVAGPLAARGAVSDVGVIEPASISTTDPIVVGIRGGSGALADWRWSTSVFFDVSGAPLGGDEGSLFVEASGAAHTVRAPLIPGLSMHATIRASHPRGDAEGGFQRWAEVWSGRRALSVAPILLDLAVGPELVRPAHGGALSRRGLDFSWRSPGAAALSTLTVVDTTRACVRYRVHTDGGVVSNTRLAQLGVPELMLGAHAVDLATAPGVGVDEAVSPDPATRRRRSDRSRPGMSTHLRVLFEVTK